MAVAHREKFAVVQVVNLAVGRVPDMDMSGCKFLYILRIYMCSSPHLQHHLAVHHHPGRSMALDTGLPRRGLRGRTHQRAPCYAYASLGELAFPVHCGGEADIRQVLPALAFQEGFACTPSQLPMGAKTDNRHHPAIAVIGRSVMARWAAASRSGAPAPLCSTTPPQFLAACIAKGS